MSENEVRAQPHVESRWTRSRALIERMARLERIIYTSIARAVLRRPAVEPGATALSFHRGSTTIFVVFIALATLELVVLDLVLQQWIIARIVFDVLDAWALVWMIGLLCAHLMRPHTVGPGGIHVRDGFDLDIGAGWDDVHSVEIVRHRYEPKTPRLLPRCEPPTVAVIRSSETNLEVAFERPTTVFVPGRPPAGGAHAIERLRLWADDPRAFLDAARPYLMGEGRGH